MAGFSTIFTYALVLQVLVFSQEKAIAFGVPHSIDKRSSSGDGEVLAGSGDGEGASTNLPVECTPEFQRETNHTMCKVDDPRVIEVGVSEEEKKLIVDLHNRLRAKIKPAAEDLSKLIWDDEIAAVAQKVTQQCVMEHDKNRNVPSYGVSIGQNLAAGYSNWTGSIIGWYNEIELYKFGVNPHTYLNEGEMIGHFTQLVYNNTYRIGCGFSRCRSSYYGTYYACNYGQGQTGNGILYPYTRGERCHKCPTSCKDGLCDCNGKMCLNGGKLDIDSCTCECPAIYSGSSCEELNCPASDDSICWRIWKEEDCVFTNVGQRCPYMCGVCQGGTRPPVFTSNFGCTYIGHRPTQEECQHFGENGGYDRKSCSTRGGGYNCSHCTSISNLVTDFCPIMCGYCDDYCNGKTCQNGGRVDFKTCECVCPVPYSGKSCETVDCPDSDQSSCGSYFKPADCKIYYNVPELCPWMCGRCGEVPVFESALGCEYVGRRPSKEQCEQYGDGGDDKWPCKSKGGDWDCNACIKYSNVKKDYCPVMCGLCDAPCGGKVCQNKGKLDTETCTCTCPAHFSGDTCETANCPKNDKWACKLYKQPYCNKFSNVPEECPHKCGLCSN